MWMYLLGALLGGKTGQASTTASTPQQYAHLNLGSPFGANVITSPVPAGALRPGTGRLYSQTGHIARGPVAGVAARQAYTGSRSTYVAATRTVSTYRAAPVASTPTKSTTTYGSSSGGTGSQYFGASAYNRI